MFSSCHPAGSAAEARGERREAKEDTAGDGAALAEFS